MMKRVISTALVLCLLSLFPTFGFAWETAIDPLLLTTRVSVWDEFPFSIGVVDANGGLWRYDGVFESQGDWWHTLQGLAAQGKLTRVGDLSHSELFELESLVYTINTDNIITGNNFIDDGDTTERYAFRTNINDDGVMDTEIILLGTEGSDMREHTCPAAQALYKRLATLFPDIQSVDYGPGTVPAGFQPVPIAEYCRISGIDAENIVVRCYDSDCEIGLIDVELSEKEQQDYLNLIRNGFVTGMANATMVTSGTTVIVFETADGTRLGSLEFYRGLLCANDGMYEIETAE